MHLAYKTCAVPFLGNKSDQCKFVGLGGQYTSTRTLLGSLDPYIPILP